MGSVVSQYDVDYTEALREVQAIVGFELANRLDVAAINRNREAEERGIRQHGAVIFAAITGDLMAWPGCVPTWDNRPDDI